MPPPPEPAPVVADQEDLPDAGTSAALSGRVSVVLRAAVVASYAGITVLRPALPHNTAFVDPLLAAVCLGALLSMSRHGSPATSAGVKALPWIWLIILGSFLGLAGVGMALWGVSDLAVSMFAILTFFAFWHLVYLHRLERYAIWGTAFGLGLTTLTVTIDGRLRNKGLFAQPNYPAHYAVLATVMLVYASRRWWTKGLAILALLVIVKETGSFGSLAMIATILAVLGWRMMAKGSAVLAALLVVLFGVGLFVVSSFVTTGSSGLNTRVPNISGTGISQSRFNRSQGERFTLWSQDINDWLEHPFGVGPAGVVNRKIALLNGGPLQVHDDLLSFLVERGPIGVIGLVGLWVVIWRAGRPRGLARLMVLALFVASLFRQTMHYRHVWLLLALALAFDNRRNDEDAAAREAEPPDVVVAGLADVPEIGLGPMSPHPGLA